MIPKPRFLRELFGEPIPPEDYAPPVYAIVEPLPEIVEEPPPPEADDPEPDPQVTTLEDVSFPSDNRSEYITRITPESLVGDKAPDYVKQILRLLIDAYGSDNVQGNTPPK